MQTRGVKVALDATLLKKTQEERRIERETKEAEKRAEKEKKTAAATKKKAQQQEAGARIAAIEDDQVQTMSERLLLQPDIGMFETLARDDHDSNAQAVAHATSMVAPGTAPGTTRDSIRGSTRGSRGNRGSRAHGGGALGGRGAIRGGGLSPRGDHATARGGGRTARSGGQTARGGGETTSVVGHATSRHGSHGGKKGTRAGPVEELPDMHQDGIMYNDVEDNGPTDEPVGEVGIMTADTSDVDMPPGTELDTESEGGRVEVELEERDENLIEDGAAEFDDNDLDEDYMDEEEEEEYDDDDGESDHGRGKKVSKRSEPKEAKLAIRHDIVATRTTKPLPLVQPLKNAKRRAGSNEGHEQSKKRAKATLGGLDKDWKSVYGHRSAATSSSSVASVASTRTQSSEGIVGEFDVDESAEATETSRRTKLSAGGVNNPKQTVANIKLVPANVAEIDRKDRVKSTAGSVSGRRNVPSSKNLPFVHPQDKQIWENHFLPELYGWQGVVKEQFSSSSHAEFNSIVRNAWLRWFDHLPPQYQDIDGVTCERVNHPAIQSVAQAALSTYRSDLANKKALLFVEQKMNEEVIPEEDFDITECRKAWVQEQLNGMSILYEFPGDDKINTKPSGLFKSEVFSKTLAYHLYKMRDSGKYIWFGHPAGALALSAAAIKRALTIWKDGVKPKMKPEDDVGGDGEKRVKQAARNGPTSFSQAHWGGTVNHYFDNFTSKLSDVKFEEIVAYAEFYLPESSKALFRSTQEGVDENDDLVMSD
ncbi:hypothetical protein K435DRAFT_849850 [Dendrothele bispora CBS 962.96]|uniref:DUF6532 domain-containing protein n=1 Tax=Dendrothele bispora (strain CBS 962.96) TaxID=1314807 RepID=A0A4S8MR99_DENBC|nr:hypothetical protein K435DRAFT_849850 [Dendrothele bispora CBS 962.96]